MFRLYDNPNRTGYDRSYPRLSIGDLRSFRPAVNR